MSTKRDTKSSPLVYFKMKPEERAAKVDEMIQKGTPDAFDSLGNTLLIAAIDHKEDALVEKLLSGGASPKLENRDNELPIVIACHHANVKILDRLVAAGADIFQTNRYGMNIIMNVVYNNNDTLLGRIIEMGKLGAQIEQLVCKTFFIALEKASWQMAMKLSPFMIKKIGKADPKEKQLYTNQLLEYEEKFKKKNQLLKENRSKDDTYEMLLGILRSVLDKPEFLHSEKTLPSSQAISA